MREAKGREVRRFEFPLKSKLGSIIWGGKVYVDLTPSPISRGDVLWRPRLNIYSILKNKEVQKAMSTKARMEHMHVTLLKCNTNTK